MMLTQIDIHHIVVMIQNSDSEICAFGIDSFQNSRSLKSMGVPLKPSWAHQVWVRLEMCSCGSTESENDPLLCWWRQYCRVLVAGLEHTPSPCCSECCICWQSSGATTERQAGCSCAMLLSVPVLVIPVVVVVNATSRMERPSSTLSVRLLSTTVSSLPMSFSDSNENLILISVRLRLTSDVFLNVCPTFSIKVNDMYGSSQTVISNKCNPRPRQPTRLVRKLSSANQAGFMVVAVPFGWWLVVTHKNAPQNHDQPLNRPRFAREPYKSKSILTRYTHRGTHTKRQTHTHTQRERGTTHFVGRLASQEPTNERTNERTNQPTNQRNCIDCVQHVQQRAS